MVASITIAPNVPGSVVEVAVTAAPTGVGTRTNDTAISALRMLTSVDARKDLWFFDN